MKGAATIRFRRVLGAVFGTVVTVLTGSHQAAWAGADDLLVLSSRDSVFEVYGMGLDGSQPYRVIPKGGAISDAQWSPQGDRIAYVAASGRYAHVFLFERASGQVRQLTQGEHLNSHPRFSPDGKRLVFVSDRDGNAEIYVMAADGSGQTRLTQYTEDDGLPAWSPDGRQIAFLRNQDRRDVWVMNADGSGARNLSNSPKVDDSEPLWSPDGSRILFGTRRNDNVEISSIAPDGTDRKVIISNMAFNHSLRFSPDGKRLAWVSNTGGRGSSSVWVANSDASQPRNLTDSPREDMGPQWTPDSRRIVFASTRTTRPAIFSVALDGTDLQQLTWAIGQDLQPQVRPIPGTQVVSHLAR